MRRKKKINKFGKHNGGKVKEKSEDKEVLGLSQETKNGIWGVASLGLAIVSMLAFVGNFKSLFCALSLYNQTDANN